MFVHPPVCLYAPHTFIHPPYVHMAPWGCTPPRGPHVSVLLHGFGTLHVVGGCFSVLYVLGHTTPIWGCLPLYYTPHTVVGSVCIIILRDISSYVGLFPLLLKGLGVFPPSLGEVGVTHQ